MRKHLTPQSYFYHDILQSYCTNFGGTDSYSLSPDTTRFLKTSITSSRLSISTDIGLPKPAFIKSLNRQLKNNIWFSEDANTTLPMNISGQIRYKKRTKNHTFSYTYTAKKEIYEVIRDKKNPDIVKRKLIKKIDDHLTRHTACHRFENALAITIQKSK